VESLQSSLHTATGRANQLQRANELLEAQMKNLKVFIADSERRQTAAAAAAASDETKRHEVSELKQQVKPHYTVQRTCIAIMQ